MIKRRQIGDITIRQRLRDQRHHVILPRPRLEVLQRLNQIILILPSQIRRFRNFGDAIHPMTRLALHGLGTSLGNIGCIRRAGELCNNERNRYR